MFQDGSASLATHLMENFSQDALVQIHCSNNTRHTELLYSKTTSAHQHHHQPAKHPKQFNTPPPRTQMLPHSTFPQTTHTYNMTVACHYLACPARCTACNTRFPTAKQWSSAPRFLHAADQPVALSHSPQPSAYHNTNGFTSSSHPLSKVLFIFPSRYLFTIGFVSVFSFRWCLPPLLGCIPKQPDSSKQRYTAHLVKLHGILTLSNALFQGTLTNHNSKLKYHHFYKLQFTSLKVIPISSFSHFVRHYYGNPC